MLFWIRTYVGERERSYVRKSLIKEGKESFLTLRGWWVSFLRESGEGSVLTLRKGEESFLI